jgi:CheY-like chemotaxis protein
MKCILGPAAGITRLADGSASIIIPPMSNIFTLPPAGEVASVGQGPALLLLHVNDNTDDQVLFQAACKRARVPVNWHVTDCAAKGISYLHTLVKQSRSHDVHWPDLVLLDIVMPGESGFEVLKYMRKTPELLDTPVVIFTGHDRPEFQQEAARLKADHFITKPEVFEKTVEIARTIYALYGAKNH